VLGLQLVLAVREAATLLLVAVFASLATQPEFAELGTHLRFPLPLLLLLGLSLFQRYRPFGHFIFIIGKACRVIFQVLIVGGGGLGGARNPSALRVALLAHHVEGLGADAGHEGGSGRFEAFTRKFGTPQRILKQLVRFVLLLSKLEGRNLVRAVALHRGRQLQAELRAGELRDKRRCVCVD